MSQPFRRRVTTYTLADGKHRTPDGCRVTKDTPGAVPHTTETELYYGHVPGTGRKRPLVALCADKAASKTMLAKMQTDAKLATVGLADRFEQHNRRPLAEHLADYRRHLKAKGNCPQHVQKTCARIHAVFAGCRFVFLLDLDAGRAADFLHGLRSDPRRPALPLGQEWFAPKELLEALGGVKPARLGRVLRRENLPAAGTGKARRYPRATVEALQERFCRGIGAGTSNGYLAAIKGFTRWLANTHPARCPSNPLASLSRLNAKVDVRHQRRALEETDLRALLAAAGDSPLAVDGLAGADRAMLYAVAMTTGLRAGELASLLPVSFDLAGAAPSVRVRAAYSKNRRDAVQPLPADVAEALRDYLSTKPAGLPVWPGCWPVRAAAMLRIDLETAGVHYRDSEGSVADFHALRHSYITLLSRSGVSPKLAQELARHSDIRLTMNVYTHAGLYDLRGAVESLPALLPKTEPQAAALAATGTEGGPRAVSRLHRFGGTERDLAGPGGTTTPVVTVGCHHQKTQENTGNKSNRDLSGASGRKLPGQDSNLDKENQNLLCYRYTTG